MEPAFVIKQVDSLPGKKELAAKSPSPPVFSFRREIGLTG